MCRFWSVVNEDGSSAIAWSILLSQKAAAERSSPFATNVEMQLLLTEHFIPCCGRRWESKSQKTDKLLFLLIRKLSNIYVIKCEGTISY
ncbi:unnamed protein product, partial [Musa textilis]